MARAANLPAEWTPGNRQQPDRECHPSECHREKELSLHWPSRGWLAQRGDLQCDRQLQTPRDRHLVLPARFADALARSHPIPTEPIPPAQLEIQPRSSQRFLTRIYRNQIRPPGLYALWLAFTLNRLTKLILPSGMANLTELDLRFNRLTNLTLSAMN